jgi:acetoin utilization deacetylase AcuC-like enzyme
LLRIYYDPAFLLHDAGIAHPESPRRLEAIMAAARTITGAQIIQNCRRATFEEIELVHTPAYTRQLRNISSDSIVMLDPDTAFSPHSMDAALKAAGSIMQAIDFVFENSGNRAFCAVRPPGHHAEPDTPMGFCIFNNIAVGAAYALKNKLADKIAIVDWDVHHCNGTQKIFYKSPRVLVISLHQYPFYPGSGGSFETGEEAGLGYTINLPMRPGAGDPEYRQAFDEIILPAINNYKPELLMISAGFDAHKDDPLAYINLSTAFYGEMTTMLADKANNLCRGRIVSVLEGGYDLNVLYDCAKIHLEMLNENT